LIEPLDAMSRLPEGEDRHMCSSTGASPDRNNPPPGPDSCMFPVSVLENDGAEEIILSNI
jgi:hypothetical protein